MHGKSIFLGSMRYLQFLILLSLASCGHLPFVTAQSYRVQNITSLGGSGQSQVYALLEDSRKFLWIGTHGGGLLRYDGQRTISYASQSGRFIHAIFEDSQHNIWVGSEKGLLCFNGQTFKAYPIDPSPGFEIRCILDGADGYFNIGTNGGIYQLNAKTAAVQFIPSSTKKPLDIQDGLTDRKGRQWFASRQGLWQLKGKRLISYGTEKGLNSLDLRALATDADDRLWIATYESGLNILDAGEMERWEQSDFVEDKGGINDLLIDPDGSVWLATERSGLLIWQANSASFQQLQITDGLESNNLRTLLLDSWQNHWIGAAGGGLSKCTQSLQAFISYGQKEGLPEASVQAIYSDPVSGLWIATANQLFFYDGRSFTNYSERSGWPSMRIVAIRKGASDRLWLATARRGILLVEENRVLTIDKDGGLRASRVKDIQLDSMGRLWVATASAGLCRITAIPTDSAGTQFSFDYYDQSNGWPDFLQALHLDKRGRIWWADADGAIGCYQDSIRLEAGRRKGLDIHCLAEDNLGYLWGSTRRNGIFRLNIYQDSLRFRFFGRKNGLSSNNTHFLLPEAEGHLWVGNASGVDRLRLKNGQLVGRKTFFGIGQGFKGGEAGRYAAVMDEFGRRWFGTSNGLMRYAGAVPTKENKPPILRLTELRLGGQAIGKSAFADNVDFWGGIKRPIELPHTINDLQFDFVGIDYAQAPAVRYQWKMSGRFEDWLPATERSTATFSNLPPGDYAFIVKASDGELETVPLEIPIRITPPFWQTAWFQWSVLGLGLLLLFGLFRQRLNRVKARAAQERERLELEKNLLQLEQKALQLQMNPHFIFNALNTIQSQINATDHRNARYQLAKFAKLMRGILENSRSEKILLEEEVRLLENYLAIEAFSRGHSFEYAVTVDERLDVEQVLIPPMMLQPFVENAIIHGVAHLSGQGRVLVGFRQKGRLLECTVEDNGIGRQAAQARRSQQAEGHRSVALEVTQERLALLGGENGKGLQIEDIRDESGAVAGTIVRLLLPTE
ncbi:MAG: two-component regulator propeller domain-containing protein [Bacteroidota bacterium]